jgi:UDP-2-acetamido-3-amino-2,3-dideoxy-glucuronate N-acetyltransferase
VRLQPPCIQHRRQPEAGGREGVRVLQVLKSSQKSLDDNGLPVTIEGEAPPRGDGDYFAHPTALVDEDVSIGKGARVWHFSHLLAGSRIGPNTNIGQNVVIGPNVTIGSDCKIQNNVSV